MCHNIERNLCVCVYPGNPVIYPVLYMLVFVTGAFCVLSSYFISAVGVYNLNVYMIDIVTGSSNSQMKPGLSS